MDGLPRSAGTAGAIMMAHLSNPFSAAGPVLASVVGAVGVGSTVGLRARKNVVLIGSVAKALYRGAFLCQCGRLGECVPKPRLFKGVPVQAPQMLAHPHPLRLEH